MISSDFCFICATLEIECAGKRDGRGEGRTLGDKAIGTLKSVSERRKDRIHELLNDKDQSFWVTNYCYKKYSDLRKPFGNEVIPADNQQPSVTTRSKSTYNYKTHCLICEDELDFDLAAKRPDVVAYQISTIVWVKKKTKKCQLHETLRKHCAGKTDPVSLEVSAKLQYADCIRLEEAISPKLYAAFFDR